MPKARKTKGKAKKKVNVTRKLRKRLKRAHKAQAAHRAKGMDEKQRELILAVVNRLGASCAIFEDNPDTLIVTQFNHPPFNIDYVGVRVLEVGPSEVKVGAA